MELGNGYIFYGKDSELVGADRESQEISMLAQHLLQSVVVRINTLLLQPLPDRQTTGQKTGRGRPARDHAALLVKRQPLRAFRPGPGQPPRLGTGGVTAPPTPARRTCGRSLSTEIRCC